MVTKIKKSLRQYLQENSYNVLSYAVVQHDHDELEAFLTLPHIVNLQRFISKAFITAVNINNMIATRIILRHGNITSIQKGTTLKYAAIRHRTDLVNAILEVDHQVPISRSDLISALETARKTGDHSIFSRLYGYCKHFLSSESKMYYLTGSIKNHQFLLLHEMVAQEGVTLLHHAWLRMSAEDAAKLKSQLPALSNHNRQVLLLQAIRHHSTDIVRTLLPLVEITPSIIRKMIDQWKRLPHPNEIDELILPSVNGLLDDEVKDEILQSLPKSAICSWVQYLGLGIGGEGLANVLEDADAQTVLQVLRLCVRLKYLHLIMPLLDNDKIPYEEVELIRIWASVNHFDLITEEFEQDRVDELESIDEITNSPTMLPTFQPNIPANTAISQPEAHDAFRRHSP